MESFKVKVAKLNELIKPFSFSPPGWKTPVTKNEVDIALFKIDLLNPEKRIKTRQDNVRRVAWYAAHGFGKPITLKVKSPTEIEVVEGHHQLMAAVIRGDILISVLVEGDPAHLVGILLTK